MIVRSIIVLRAELVHFELSLRKVLVQSVDLLRKMKLHYFRICQGKSAFLLRWKVQRKESYGWIEYILLFFGHETEHLLASFEVRLCVQ